MILRTVFVLVFIGSWAHAQTPQPQRPGGSALLSSLGAGLGLAGSEKSVIVYGGGETPERDPSGLRQHRLNISTPLYKGENNTLAVSLGGGMLHLDRPVVLEDSNTMVPSDFYRTELGMQFNHRMEGDRQWGLRLSAGYANDKPFNGSRDTTFTLAGTYSYPGNESSYWVLTIFASNSSSFLPNYVPIPGFLYLYRGEKFSGMFGLPISVIQWRPVEPWTVAFSLFGANVSSDLIYGRTIQTYAGAGLAHQSYMRAARENDKDRIYFTEKKVYVGMRSPMFLPIGADLQVGQSFERTVQESTSAFKSERGKKSLGSSWYLTWNLRYIF
ncbi:MAG: hypothetical protein KF799_00265 [Bdellovibrionales bacterium]|nr:hypothetical protein [Bdellovibrionales bacterium]